MDESPSTKLFSGSLSQKEVSNPELFKAMQEFQYGETKEISDKGFEKMKKMTESQENKTK